MCPSEHLHTAVSPGTSAGLEVSIRRTVTLSPQLSHVNPRHKKFGMAYRFTLPSALVMKAFRNRSQLTRSAAVLHVLVVARGFHLARRMRVPVLPQALEVSWGLALGEASSAISRHGRTGLPFRHDAPFSRTCVYVIRADLQNLACAKMRHHSLSCSLTRVSASELPFLCLSVLACC